MPFSISCPTKIYFGAGTHRKLAEVLPQGIGAVILVKGRSDQTSAPVRAVLKEAGITVRAVSCSGEPTIASVNIAWELVRAEPCACIVVCGGGSAIDTGKALAVALAKGAPLTDDDFGINHSRSGGPALIALPTTAGTGSEVTSNAVLGADGSRAKISLRGAALQPSIALVDPDLMRGAPKSVVLFSGLDAVVQNIEAYTSAYATPFTRALSGPAIGATLSALQDVIADDTSEAWSQMAWGSLSSGIALANGGLGAAHGLASILGGAYDAPHGGLCGRLLTPVLRANIASPHCTPQIREGLMMCQQAITDRFAPTDRSDPFPGFEDWLGAQGLPRLSDWGVAADEVDALAVAARTASSTLKNAVTLEAGELAKILRDAL